MAASSIQTGAGVIGGTCTNQVVTAISTTAVPTCTTITSAYANGTIVKSVAAAAFTGAFTFTATLTNTTAVTFPTSGTLATTAQLPTVTGGTCTNQVVTAISSSAVPTCTTITSAYTTGFALLASANTFSAQQIISLAGAASTPPVILTGTWFSGGTATTTKPQLLVECNSGTTTSTGWSTSGTGLAVNACSGFTGNLIDAQLNGVSVMRLPSTGLLTITGGSNPGLSISGGSANYSFNTFFLSNAQTGLGIDMTNTSGGFVRIGQGIGGGGGTAGFTIAVQASFKRTTLTSSLPTCTATTGSPWQANVSDATAPAIGAVLVGGGTIWASVHCSLTTGTYIVDGI